MCTDMASEDHPCTLASALFSILLNLFVSSGIYALFHCKHNGFAQSNLSHKNILLKHFIVQVFRFRKISCVADLLFCIIDLVLGMIS
jgi:hypothetical protein